MSLAIDIDRVFAVLLADGWHDCDLDDEGNSTFELDAYEYRWGHGFDSMMRLAGGQEQLIPATGFMFKENHVWIYGPLTSILAIKRGD